ncbi:Calcium/calmodulin-dependent protein kinase cmkA like [Verticillium longisporum]|uniref:Calcium/calmodulin-dependent protein kinase cmkA like n=1 Tax=Verticillium longisporum TaxID=100787 RepID=A0A8I2ZIR9_VERLO|nr:Calcium/calmodulin-dependent protein kinase cmkA like [Verticillium longisporum]
MTGRSSSNPAVVSDGLCPSFTPFVRVSTFVSDHFPASGHWDDNYPTSSASKIPLNQAVQQLHVVLNISHSVLLVLSSSPLLPPSACQPCWASTHHEHLSRQANHEFFQHAQPPPGPARKLRQEIILKKNVKGNERMVYDELEMLQRLKHPHIVKFVDWFESRDKYYIITELATGGELFDRICEQGKFTEKDASQTIKQVLDAVNYLHMNSVVHRDLKPENLLYRSRDSDSEIVLADFGIAKMLDRKDEVLTTMAGSFGYAAPEVMLKRGHGKPVDMWSMGVITYTLLCGYSPFRSENLQDLIDECSSAQPEPEKRWTSEEALSHAWLSGDSATDHNLLPEIKAYMAKARLRRGIEMVKLANRIESLKLQEDDPDDTDFRDEDFAKHTTLSQDKKALSKAVKGAIFREVVFAKVREMKQQQETLTVKEEAEKEHKRRSFHG